MAKVEIHLRQAEDRFRFPINPPELMVDGNAVYTDEKIIKRGEVSIFEGKGLKEVSWEASFPLQEYPYVQYKGFPTPLECCKKLDRWMDEGWILRLTVTECNINMECTITNFSYGRADASGDIKYSITIKQYDRIKVLKVDEKPPKPQDNKPRPEGNPPKPQRTHKVMKGDNLWDIAKKYYGKGSQWPKIRDANISKYPSLKTDNTIYSQPPKAMTLIIP